MFGLGKLTRKLFGTSNERFVRTLKSTVDKINAKEPEIQALSDEALAAQTQVFRDRLAKGETLDNIMIDAFATVREAARRVLGQRHYDVQLIGGMILHQGKITEMKTGEGKTLVATLAAYLNAIEGKGVHVVTVNDYLARRDSETMGRVYKFLGLTVGVVVPGMDDFTRKEAYGSDITYATNNELGFDYLRDNMKYSRDMLVQRPFNFAVIDEVDSILIDEARTPLIISGPSEDKSELYVTVDAIIPDLVEGDYELDEKSRQITLTEDGTEHAERLLEARGLLHGNNLYDSENVAVVHHLNQALKAHKLFQIDRDYIVKEDKVIIIDEFTGRMMEGRRYSEGLHQALEAKERVEIQPENQTLASITFQNYFRLYPKLAGMTGTALTEATEFADIYGLGVVDVPTNVPVQRIDEHDEVYRTVEEKFNAIIDQIDDAQKRGQPILVGTVSIEKSEYLSEKLKARNIEHNVLNARYHEQEAYIISQAGRSRAVTIATNMAGRGTDIQLGGNVDMRIAVETADITDDADREKRIQEIRDEVNADRETVLAAGGLFVVGTERHESRRIDNQLRGRSGRQGDPGRSKFFLSLQDDLMRIFGSERMEGMLVKLGLEEGEAIIHPWINRAIEKAQEKVEARNYDVRKNLLKYDNVMNDQRKVVYEQRREIMDATDVSDTIVSMRHEVVESLVANHIPERSYPEQWNSDDLNEEVERIFSFGVDIKEWAAEEGIDGSIILERLHSLAESKMAERTETFGEETLRSIEKTVLLQSLDQHWKEHLSHLDALRQVVGLRAYAQRDPLNEYRTEAFNLFENMLAQVRDQVTMLLAHVQLAPQQLPTELQEPDLDLMIPQHIDPLTGENEAEAPINWSDPEIMANIPRNAPCPCGSGKKFKHCHGAI